MGLYSEETKKLEEVCLEAMHMMERMAQEVQRVGFASSAPPIPNPLLKGMPGREISPAKTDGARFAGDFEAPPVLAYPYDLSRQKFEQHPIAKELAMSQRQKVELGLILPREEKSRDFYYDLDSDDDGTIKGKKNAAGHDKTKKFDLLKKRRRGKVSRNASPAPRLPSIPEHAKLQQVLHKLVNRGRPGPERQDRVNTPAPQSVHATSGSSKFNFGKNRPAPRPKISGPQMQIQDSMAGVPKSFPTSIHFAKPSYEEASAALFNEVLRDHKESRGPCEPSDSKSTYEFAAPRLSPMEYARMYLIEMALAKRENRSCDLPAPEKAYYWTPNWEKFIVIPKMPAYVRRGANENIKDNAHKGMHVASREAPVGQRDNIRSETVQISASDATGCPRLSLHLGGETPLMPSFGNGHILPPTTEQIVKPTLTTGRDSSSHPPSSAALSHTPHRERKTYEEYPNIGDRARRRGDRARRRGHHKRNDASAFVPLIQENEDGTLPKATPWHREPAIASPSFKAPANRRDGLWVRNSAGDRSTNVPPRRDSNSSSATVRPSRDIDRAMPKDEQARTGEQHDTSSMYSNNAIKASDAKLRAEYSTASRTAKIEEQQLVAPLPSIMTYNPATMRSPFATSAPVTWLTVSQVQSSRRSPLALTQQAVPDASGRPHLGQRELEVTAKSYQAVGGQHTA